MPENRIHFGARTYVDPSRCSISRADRNRIRADSTARNSLSSWLRLVLSSSMIWPLRQSRFCSRFWICSATLLCIVHNDLCYLRFILSLAKRAYRRSTVRCQWASFSSIAFCRSGRVWSSRTSWSRGSSSPLLKDARGVPEFSAHASA